MKPCFHKPAPWILEDGSECCDQCMRLALMQGEALGSDDDVAAEKKRARDEEFFEERRGERDADWRAKSW